MTSILVVEHHQDHQALLEAALRGENGTIESVGTGEAALVRLGMADFDCVVLGSPVPVSFGSEDSTMLDLFDLLAPNLASRLVIVVSVPATEIVRRALRMRAYAVFLAPFDPAELREAVRMCVRGEEPSRRLHGTSAQIEELLIAGDRQQA